MVACRFEGFFLRRRRRMPRLLIILNGPGQTPEIARAEINLQVRWFVIDRVKPDVAGRALTNCQLSGLERILDRLVDMR